MKAIFSDMDGTIIHMLDMLHEKDKEMMHRLQEAGYVIAFNTGRNFQEASYVVERHQLPYDYLVLNNGAHIVDKEGTDIFKKVIPDYVGKKIIEYCMSVKGLWVHFFNGHRTLGYLNGKTYEHTEKGHVLNEQLNFIEEYQKVKDFDIIAVNQENHQVDTLLHIQEYITTHFGEQASSCLNTEYLDITATGCTKGTGLEAVKELLGGHVETYCIGDSFNDLSMFEVADHAYTFHHVDEEVSKHADKQVAYVHELIEDMLR